jgi:hypothetical protein
MPALLSAEYTSLQVRLTTDKHPASISRELSPLSARRYLPLPLPHIVDQR